MKPSYRILVLAVALATGSLSACAVALNPATGDVQKRNTAAMADYDAGKHKDARRKLIEAIAIADEKGLGESPVVAQTRFSLGIVYAGGMKQRKPAVEQMSRALIISPTLTLSERYRKPPIIKAFEEAKNRAEKARTEKAPAVVPVAGKAIAANTVTEKNDKPPHKGRPAVGETRAKKGRGAKVGNKVEEKVAVTEPTPVAVDTSTQEATVPRPLPEPVYCPVPDEVPPATDATITCAIGPGLAAGKPRLYYRRKGATEFAPADMNKSAQGWHSATIASADLSGSMLHYYVQVEGNGGKVLSSTGDFGSPEVILIRAGAKATGSVLTVAQLDDLTSPSADTATPVAADSPPVDIENEKPRGLDEEEKASPEAATVALDESRFWVGLQLGSGLGFHGATSLEFRTMQSIPSGSAAASLFHLLPEAGYRLSSTWAVSLQSRHQIITASGGKDGLPGGPARGANSVLLRAHYQLLTHDKFDLQIIGGLGGGEGIRLLIKPDASLGRSGDDTIRIGPILVDTGVGAGYRLNPDWSVVALARMLTGLPDFGLLFEGNLGARYDFH
jgi:hypothetical protein